MVALKEIRQKVLEGVRLNFEDGVRLFESGGLAAIGSLANAVRRKRHGKKVYYAVNLHLNHTNVCTGRCIFCAFKREPGEAGAYALELDDVFLKAKRAVERFQINEVHIVGGLNPDLSLDYYAEMCRGLRALDSRLFIKALTAVEIDDLARRSNRSWGEVLESLREAGLNGLTGGGAEIFAEKTRRKICADKISSADWLEIHRTAHRLGLYSNCTMLYGHIESIEDRVDHILRLRALQDETGGFQSFVPLAFNSENNPLGQIEEPGGWTDLKVLAAARLLFDNVEHIKIHWTALDLKLAQVSFAFGADDAGGTNLDERIMHEAGNETPTDLSEASLKRIIEQAGYEPVRVDSSYSVTIQIPPRLPQ